MNEQQSAGEARSNQKKAWYKNGWGLVIAILLFPYFLFWYMWAKTNWNKWVKVIITIVFVFINVVALTGDDQNKSGQQTNEQAEQKTVVANNKVEQKKEETIPLLGDEFILKYDEETDNKIFIVDTDENYIDFVESSAIKDTEGSAEIFKKHVISVDNGTRVRVIDYAKSDEGIRYKGIKVRVLEGEKYNATGYATIPFLKKINENDSKKLNENNQAESKEADTVQSNGLNVKRDDVIKTLTSNESALVFEKGKPMDGQENYVASASSKGINVQMVGSQENLSQASVTLFLDTNNREQINNAFRFLGVASNALNSSDEAKKWLGSEVEYYLKNKYKDYTHSKKFGNNKYEMQSILMIDIPSIILTISYAL